MDEMTGTREKLLTACRILAQAGVFDDFGYFSARCGNGDQVLMNPATALDRMTREDLLLFDLDDTRMAKDSRFDGDLVLHRTLYQKRPDAMAVVHTHSPMVVTLSIAGIRLKAVENVGAIIFPSEVPLHDQYGPVTDIRQANEVADAMGPGNIIVLRGHGLIATGASIEETCMTALYAERCAGFQYRTVLIGGAFPYPQRDRGKIEMHFSDGKFLKRSWNYFQGTLTDRPKGKH
jgi:ribulose-5-phosphate 4-epimerase/fuculose-1-phosphate aldolase